MAKLKIKGDEFLNEPKKERYSDMFSKCGKALAHHWMKLDACILAWLHQMLYL